MDEKRNRRAATLEMAYGAEEVYFRLPPCSLRTEPDGTRVFVDTKIGWGMDALIKVVGECVPYKWSGPRVICMTERFEHPNRPVRLLALVEDDVRRSYRVTLTAFVPGIPPDATMTRQGDVCSFRVKRAVDGYKKEGTVSFGLS